MCLYTYEDKLNLEWVEDFVKDWGEEWGTITFTSRCPFPSVIVVVVHIRCPVLVNVNTPLDNVRQMHNVLRLFVDGHNPGDEVGRDQVHAAQVRSAPALVDLDP